MSNRYGGIFFKNKAFRVLKMRPPILRNITVKNVALFCRINSTSGV